MRRGNKKRDLNKRSHCYYCINQVDIDYKDTKHLRRSLSSYGKIVPRKRSGVCASHQRQLSRAIKRARIMALLPFVNK